MLFDNSYDFEEIRLNGQPLNGITVARGEWKQEGSAVRPAPNKWNQVLLGDTGVYDCDFTLKIRRTKGSGPTQLRLRDNGKQGDEADFIGMNIGTGRCELFHQAGGVLDSLGVSVPFPFESNRWYTVRLVCERERIQCYVDGELTHDVQMRPLPSLVSVSTIDEAKQLLYVKVVNTTASDLNDARVTATVYDLKGNIIHTQNAVAGCKASDISEAMTLTPSADGLQFIRLCMKDAGGRLVSENFYWHNGKEYLAYEELADMPEAALKARLVSRDGSKATFELINKSRNVSFANRLRLVEGKKKEAVLPVIWSDNYVTLMPGEKKVITIEMPDNTGKVRLLCKQYHHKENKVLDI